MKFLEKTTNTPFKGFLSGFIATTIFNSSAVTTLLAIGFINAGILTFLNSLWVIFGANVGTSMTAWIVALVGLKLDMSALALPMIGLGVIMQMLNKKKFGAFGNILAGFGILFYGLGVLSDVFIANKDNFDLTPLLNLGVFSNIAFLLTGLILTMLAQSSTVTTTLILILANALSTTETPLPVISAAAAIIGSNIGSTITAIFASVGATANAKRATMAHILFNVIAAVFVFLFLPFVVNGAKYLINFIELPGDIATELAFFHSFFNVIGAILMIPLSSYMAKFLQKCFTKDDVIMEKPKFLDDNLLSVPALAVESLTKEIDRYREIFIISLHGFISHLQGKASMRPEIHKLDELGTQITNFIGKLAQENISPEVTEQLTQSLRIRDQYVKNTEYLKNLIVIQDLKKNTNEHIEADLQKYFELLEKLIEDIDTTEEMQMQTLSEEKISNLTAEYQHLKQLFITSMISKKISLKEMEENTYLVRILRRILMDFAKVQKISAKTQNILKN